ncbi:MCE family protein [Roseococcus sp. SYP-B2431]|uniref:MlaD family protein n=1 Tax=Roseococcus sp. SYP-B2431 TaxID=2496640 RepID=UPI00103CBCF6|nr:MlaD family protein [Roseococcus sp. SYP-B2431]TCH99008.1 MCE family protein [Roseococcus sp. SYP-B2431]
MASIRRIQVSVGIMVLVGVGLLLGFVFFLTQNRLSGSDVVMETYIRESVQGLEVGSAVRYRGVSVGRVTAIGLASAEYRRPEGEPFAASFQLVVVRFAVNLGLVGDIPSLDDAVKLGLRARLSSQGITGVSYIELDFIDSARDDALRTLPWEPRFPWIPAVPSTVAQVQSAAEMVMRQLQDIDFATLFGTINSLATELRDQVKAAELSGAVQEATALLADFRRTLGAADIPGVLGEVRNTTVTLRETVNSPDVRNALASLAAATQDLRRTAARLPGTITQLDAGVRGVRSTTGDLQADLAPVLRDLRATTANLRETTEALRRSPSQAILGAPPPVPSGARR